MRATTRRFGLSSQGESHRTGVARDGASLAKRAPKGTDDGLDSIDSTRTRGFEQWGSWKAQSVATEVGVGHEMGYRLVLGSGRKMCVVRGQSSGNVGEE